MSIGRALLAFECSLVVSVWLCAGCKPGPGSSCDKGEARCLDNGRSLVCQEGKLIETPCRGPGGCSVAPDGVRCDITGNAPGDVCSTDQQGASACKDGQTMLSCRGGRYVAVTCRGPNGCQSDGSHSVCDQSMAAPLDDCDKEGTKACSVDGREVLACKQGKMSSYLLCRGPRGCTALGGKLDCDLSIAAEGDACDPKLEGHVACSPDSEKLVRCEGKRFVSDEVCKAGKRCVTSDTRTECVRP